MSQKIGTIICPLCQGPYVKPRYLPCLHTYCEACLESYIKSISTVCRNLDLPVSMLDTKPYSWTGDGFPCPVCRIHTPAPPLSRSKSPDKWTGQFPLNQLLLSIMGYQHPKEGQACGPCEKVSGIKPGKYWCVDCSESLCMSCAQHHNVLKATATHWVVAGDEKGRLAKMKHEEIVNCPHHPDKKLEMYCVDDNKIVCLECVTLDHKKCENTIMISKVSREIRESMEANKLLDKLSECMMETENVVNNRVKNIEKLDKRKEEILTRVREVKEDVVRSLTQLEKILSDDLDGIHIKEVARLDDQINRCHLLQKAIVSSMAILGAVIEHGTDTELFVAAHRMEKELRRYETVLEKEARFMTEADYNFEVNYEIEHVLLALDEIGSIKVAQRPSAISTSTKKGAKLLTQFDATSAMDTRCAELTGGTFLPDDRLLLVDNANEKLKLFTQHGDLISEFELGSAPWDVTTTRDGRAAVTLPVEKKVMLLSSENDCITPVEQIKTTGKCYGIAYSYCDDNIVLTCDTPWDGRALVKVMTMQGQETLDISDDSRGNPLFTRPSYIAVNPFNADIYVTDEANNTVTGVTAEGKYRFQYKEKYLKLPTGVAADNHGCVYVCGNGSSDIHQLSYDGKRIRFLVDSLNHPRVICFEPYGDRFLVITDGSYKSNVQLYKLQ